MKQHPLPSSDPAPDEAVVQPTRQDLEPGDDAVLFTHQGLQLDDGHPGRMRKRGARREAGCFTCAGNAEPDDL